MVAPPPQRGDLTAVNNSESSLVRVLGVGALAAGIVNITIGGGIFRLPAGAAAALGSAAPLAYVVCALAMGLIVLCFAEAGSRVSLTGGLYAYVEVAFGPFVGFVCGILLWAGITTAVAAVSSFFADAMVALIPALGAMWLRQLLLIAVVAGLALLNVFGVSSASRFNTVMTVAKLIPLALLVTLGLSAVKTENLVWHAAPGAADVARASAFLMFAFLGVETALVPSGEVRNSSRTVPRAIFLAMATVTVIYLSVQLVTQGILGAELATRQTPLADAAGVAIGPWGRQIIEIGAAVSMFGFVSGAVLAIPRMLFAFARDGFLPRKMASIHPRYRTPHVSIAIQAAVIIAIAVSGSFEQLAIVANGAILVVYTICCLAAMELRRRDVKQDGAAAFRARGGAAIPVLAILIMVWMLASLKASEWAAVAAFVVGAIVLYAVTHSSRMSRRSSDEVRTA
jgi:APA family basic amino acid/polyamine antiporter